jgi:hypothetical protein
VMTEMDFDHSDLMTVMLFVFYYFVDAYQCGANDKNTPVRVALSNYP